MPYFEIDGRSIYDDLTAPVFHFAIFHDGKSEIPTLHNDLMKEWEGRIDSHVYPLFPHISEMYGTSESFYLILRPDNYIGLISNDFSPEVVRSYFNIVGR